MSTDYPEGGPHAEGPSRVEEIRERWARKMKTALDIFAAAGQDAIVPRDQQAMDVAYLLYEVERLTADLAQTRTAAREQIAERDRIIGEVMRDLRLKLGEQTIHPLTAEVDTIVKRLHVSNSFTLTPMELLNRAALLAGVGERRRQRWSAVRSVFGLGSTSGTALCQALGLDPDEWVGDDFEEEE